jgi:hypothetical protein
MIEEKDNTRSVLFDFKKLVKEKKQREDEMEV